MAMLDPEHRRPLSRKVRQIHSADHGTRYAVACADAAERRRGTGNEIAEHVKEAVIIGFHQFLIIAAVAQGDFHILFCQGLGQADGLCPGQILNQGDRRGIRQQKRLILAVAAGGHDKTCCFGAAAAAERKQNYAAVAKDCCGL